MHPRPKLDAFPAKKVIEEKVIRVTFSKWITAAIILAGFSLLGLFLLEFFKL